MFVGHTVIVTLDNKLNTLVTFAHYLILTKTVIRRTLKISSILWFPLREFLSHREVPSSSRHWMGTYVFPLDKCVLRPWDWRGVCMVQLIGFPNAFNKCGSKVYLFMYVDRDNTNWPRSKTVYLSTPYLDPCNNWFWFYTVRESNQIWLSRVKRFDINKIMTWYG